MAIYNSRNFFILLNSPSMNVYSISTTVEIFLYYLTTSPKAISHPIYNSRNFFILLNLSFDHKPGKSTTVEIFLYYLTLRVEE